MPLSSYSSPKHSGTGSHARPTDASKNPAQQIDLSRNRQSNQPDLKGVLPTVLIAAGEELRATLASNLEADGYLVLEAGSEAEALHVVVAQTRTIHILLTDLDMNGRKLARDLHPYRPEMRIFFVTADAQNISEALSAPTAIARVRECLKVPDCVRKQMVVNCTSGAKVVRMIA